ncbi:hypothetical protein AMATHDRAFT_67871 [Amanita thiersii Skay4041]|uniref:Uncharacterized protein n=1 Tax=Amanita thiersii Skay4041 TaxID=703135 RepID=A0A2A9N922_9AGAR|nr:hypothetical protein AMATHDRAFT_67871 [Amanita thiersii Skay4041]
MQAPPSMVHSSTSVKDSFSRNAVDLVRRILEYPSGDRLGATVKLSGEGITLPDLTVLALCAHEQASTYNIISRNCYWFVYAMIDGLRRLHQGVEMDGEFSWDKIPAWFKKEWKGEQLITGYNKGKSDLQDRIDELIHHTTYQELQRKYEKLQHDDQKIISQKDNRIRELEWQLSRRHNDASDSPRASKHRLGCSVMTPANKGQMRS